jgi:hypothetical protein
VAAERYVFRAFASQHRQLHDLFNEAIQAMQREVDQAPENEILNINETDYLNYLTAKYSIEPPELDFDGIHVEDYEKEVPVPNPFSRYSGNSHMKAPRPIYKFLMPYSGDIALLGYPLSSMQMWTQDMLVEGPTRHVGFEVTSYDGHPEDVNKEQETIVRNLKQQLEIMVEKTQRFKDSLRASAEQAFRTRKDRILKRLQMNEAITVPFKKRDDVPSTFAIPTPEFRKSIIVRPVVFEQSYQPEPTLKPSDYHDILQTIFDVGKAIERLPSVYTGKDEETLRDHFLIFLEPRFGNATGETFNKKGKTDILIRYQNSNVFVAECKFWKGQQKYLETIDQLFGYLTWRDSKAAVILFVRNQEMSSVLHTIEEVSSTHPNYLGLVDKEHETWYNYRFHIQGDRNREVKLAILALHFPPIIGTETLVPDE